MAFTRASRYRVSVSRSAAAAIRQFTSPTGTWLGLHPIRCQRQQPLSGTKAQGSTTKSCRRVDAGISNQHHNITCNTSWRAKTKKETNSVNFYAVVVPHLESVCSNPLQPLAGSANIFSDFSKLSFFETKSGCSVEEQHETKQNETHQNQHISMKCRINAT
ncbi:hypothetical protein CI102_11341 [Trichoderma harzianum]|nr:hypothetical protein CI102_11341 [Trichoderma harzianum]